MNIKRLKYACYTINISMAVVADLSPILFLTFRNMYGISYSLLGLLILINFVTQLGMDLIFTFFSHKFNIAKVVKSTPIITIVGLLTYAIVPMLFPQYAYLGIVLGTVIFCASAGLCEVLISPVIAAIPSDDPDREMSKLHSTYAWGCVLVIILGTLYLFCAGTENWFYMPLIFALIPLVSLVLFCGTDIPDMGTPEKTSDAVSLLKNKGVWLSVFAIFLGGASECTMNMWSSSYLEMALDIPKVYGDIFGAAMFAVMLGLGRTLYAKFGKNIEKVLVFGAVGATLCYLIAAVSPIPILGLFACAFTGFCTAMLWPGNLVVASDRFPKGGVFIFAMMAAGGDLGGSVAPQLVGVITDAVIANPKAADLAAKLSISVEQFGMKVALLVGMIFPLIAIPTYLAIKHGKKKENKESV